MDRSGHLRELDRPILRSRSSSFTKEPSYEKDYTFNKNNISSKNVQINRSLNVSRSKKRRKLGFLNKRKRRVVSAAAENQENSIFEWTTECRVCKFKAESMEKYVLHIKDFHYNKIDTENEHIHSMIAVSNNAITQISNLVANIETPKKTSKYEVVPIQQNTNLSKSMEETNLNTNDPKSCETFVVGSNGDDKDSDSDIFDNDEMDAGETGSEEMDINKQNSISMENILDTSIANKSLVNCESTPTSICPSNDKDGENGKINSTEGFTHSGSIAVKIEPTSCDTEVFPAADLELVASTTDYPIPEHSPVSNLTSVSQATLTLSQNTTEDKSKNSQSQLSKLETIVHSLKESHINCALPKTCIISSAGYSTTISTVTSTTSPAVSYGHVPPENQIVSVTESPNSVLCAVTQDRISPEENADEIEQGEDLGIKIVSIQSYVDSSPKVPKQNQQYKSFQKAASNIPNISSSPSVGSQQNQFNTSSKNTSVIPDSFNSMLGSGLVTMTYIGALDAVEKRPEIWKVLLNSFYRFPYPPTDEIQVLSDITELSIQHIKAWFVGARLKHGISWSPDEVVNAWSAFQNNELTKKNPHSTINQNFSPRNVGVESKAKNISPVNNNTQTSNTITQPILCVSCSCNTTHQLTLQQQKALILSEKELSVPPSIGELNNLSDVTGLPQCGILSYYVLSSFNSNKPRRKTGEQTSILYRSFRKNPYLTENEVDSLTQATGMLKSEIHLFFRHARHNMRTELQKLSVNSDIINLYKSKSNWDVDHDKSHEVHKECTKHCLNFV